MSAKGWIIGSGAAVVAVGAGAATWAAVSFFGAGPQAGEALPADTIAYVSLDLDPSGKQKIEALKLANKFPALRKELGLKSTDDLRRKAIEEMAKETGCAIDYAKDVAPWIGSMAALAAVNADDPKPVIVLEVKDAEKARAQVDALLTCGGADTSAFQIDGNWMVLAEKKETVDDVIKASAQKSLADDSDFKKWTSEVGDQGFLTAYLAPSIGEAISSAAPDLSKELGSGMVPGEVLPGCPKASTDADVMSEASSTFKGAALTLRFGGDGVELAAVGDLGEQGATTGDAGVSDLPENLGFAAGASFGKDFIGQVLDQVVTMCGDKAVVDDLIAQANEATGLDLVTDLGTLTSGSIQVAIGTEFNLESLFSGGEEELPLALRFKGDADKMKAVLDKVTTSIEDNLGTEFLEMMGVADLLTPSVGKDSVTLGLSSTFNDQLAKGGKLGDSKAFKAAVPQADKAAGVVYLGLDGMKDLIVSSASSEEEKKQLEENTAPVESLGMSTWVDGSTTHGRLQLSVK